ncbi:LytTR family DNA-binding domain-containing protein [Phenylobacterium sp.]|uniref:LytTR family DNA-binding domain-containing protein n=1 Tax=Phenylobacterium sp. TaxID=1871053 RepID=UPI002625A67C|nr:LytTR family DNA-binding domain-containing protein [Phenylobacterium sp.]
MAGLAKGLWDERRGGGDERRRPGWAVRLPTDPARRQLVIGWAVVLVAAAAVCLLNVLGFTQGGRGRVGEHVVYEGSSWLAIALLAWLPWAALQGAKTWPWGLRLVAHLAAALVFSLLHVGLFILFRAAAFGVLGQPYDPVGAVGAYRYEVWKDLLAYAMFAGCYGMVGLVEAVRPAQPAAPAPPSPALPSEDLFDIRDGARLVRVRLDEILAVSSAGNYAQFHLRDGRRPMMRSSLAALAAELGPRGFVRTHRSWLVNAQAVRGLTPEGSGDYAVALDEHQTAPLSRRYPQALRRLRAPAAS